LANSGHGNAAAQIKKIHNIVPIGSEDIAI